MSKLIYVADDDKHIRDLLEMFLVDAGYETEVFDNGDRLFQRFINKPSDLVILDIMMPGHDGLKICEMLREKTDVPIIMLTAKDTEYDYVMGMTVGSDDYIMKPFRPTMLIMKIKALFRRIEIEHRRKHDFMQGYYDDTVNFENKCGNKRNIKMGNLLISEYERKISHQNSNEILNVSTMEFDLLIYMINNQGKAVSRDELLENVWGVETPIETRMIDEAIRRIRKKLNMFDCGITIETVWGYGYRIVEL